MCFNPTKQSFTKTELHKNQRPVWKKKISIFLSQEFCRTILIHFHSMWRRCVLTPGKVIFIHWKQLLHELKQIFLPHKKVGFLFFLHAGNIEEMEVITPLEFLAFCLSRAHLHSRGTSMVKQIERNEILLDGNLHIEEFYSLPVL